MAVNWSSYQVYNLAGGIQRATSPFHADKSEMKLLVNWDLKKEVGSLTKPRGYSQKGSDITGATHIRGGHSFYTTSYREMVVAVDDNSSVDLYIYDPSDNTFTAQSQTLTTGFDVDTANYLDGLFVTNFSDDPLFYNGSSWSSSTNLTGAPKAKYVIPFMDRLAMGYVDISATTHSSRVVLSELPDSSYNIGWDTSDDGLYFDFLPKDGDVIKGLGVNYNRLLVFKENSLGRYDGNSLYEFPGAPGTVNNRTIANVLDWTIYFNTSGVYGLKGNEVNKLSRQIEDIIDGVKSENLDKLCARRNGDKYELFLYDVENSDADIDIEKCMVVLDTTRMKWSVYSLEHEPTAFFTLRDDRSSITYDDSTYEYDYADKNYDGLVSAEFFKHFGASDGKIYQQFDTDYDYAGNRIRSYFETINHYPAGPPGIVQFQAMKVYINQGRRLKLFYSIDDGDWQPIEKYDQDSGEIYFKFDEEDIGNRIRLKGIDKSSGPNTKVLGFEIFYTLQSNIRHE